MVDMIAKLTKRRSRALRVQVGDPGIWGRARPLMGMAEGLCDKAPPPPWASILWPSQELGELRSGAGHLPDLEDSSLLSSFLFQGLAYLRWAAEGL